MSPITDKMSSTEIRVATVLAGVFSTRMLGLFMVVPVFSVYAQGLHGYTSALAGWAIGIYGLTQSLLQIPLGRLSDRIGRRPVILGGLVMFAIGSVVAAMSESIEGVILGRAMQGMGAIASAMMALAADLTREEHRLKVMAVIGGSIGASFTLAIILGPLLAGIAGLKGIFWVTAVLATGAMALIWFYIPKVQIARFHRDTEVEWAWLGRVLGDMQLLRLNAGVLILHFVMTSTFFSLPLIWVKQHNLMVAQHWQVYLPMMVLAILLVLPFIMLGEKKHQLKQVFILAVVFLVLASFGLWVSVLQWWALVALLGLFFVGFNILEASLPSLVAKFAPPAHRGTAMGAFSTSQFMGAFLGAVSAGWISGHYEPAVVFLINGVLVLVWLGIALSMRQPNYLSSQLLYVGPLSTAQAQLLARELTTIKGVAEAVVIPEDGVAYLKVDQKALDKAQLYKYSLAPTDPAM